MGVKRGTIFQRANISFPLHLDSFQLEHGTQSEKILRKFFPEVCEEIRGVSDTIGADYLSAEAIDAMLSSLSELCADGSSLVFDYPDEDFFAAPEKRVQNTIMMAKAGGEPMKMAFSYSEVETLLEKHGFLIYELLTPDDIQRDIIDKAGADMKAFEHVNYCLAVRKK